jgi:ribA/ribD-fused uncharacterized protein
MTLTVPDWDFLQEALAEGIPCRVEGFHGDFRFLSNFYESPIEVERLVYPTVEHAYQAAKTTLRGEHEAIARLPSPGQAKRAGSKLRPGEGWDARKVAVMEELVLLKFRTHAGLRDKLLGTGDCYLEETNTWGDRFWGVSGGSGDNHLGKVLMRVRERLRSGDGSDSSTTAE